MTQTIFLNGLDQYVIIPKIISVNNSSGDQNPVFGSSDGQLLSSLCTSLNITFAEYQSNPITLSSSSLKWVNDLGVWKLDISATNITQYGTAWVTLVGQINGTTSLIPASVEILVTPISSPPGSDFTADSPLEFLISRRPTFSVVTDSNNSEYDLEYTQNDSDQCGAVIYKDGKLLDLSHCTVQYVMLNVAANTKSEPITCVLGGYIEDYYFSASRGGVTIPFTANKTAVSGLFKGKFIITGDWGTAHAPSGNKYVSMMIWGEL